MREGNVRLEMDFCHLVSISGRRWRGKGRADLILGRSPSAPLIPPSTRPSPPSLSSQLELIATLASSSLDSSTRPSRLLAIREGGTED